MSASPAGVYGTASTTGFDVVYRIATLLRGNYFSPEYTKSPAETEGTVIPVANVPMVAGRHYSYALLNISDLNWGRSSEWRGTNNSRAAVVADRNLGTGASSGTTLSTAAKSIHTTEGEGWRGSVCYNDNHAVFETTDLLKTEYALKGEVASDGLFSDQEKTTGTTTVSNADAAFVFHDNSSYTGQNAK